MWGQWDIQNTALFKINDIDIELTLTFTNLRHPDLKLVKLLYNVKLIFQFFPFFFFTDTSITDSIEKYKGLQ